MIRFQITGQSAVEMNIAANSIANYHRYEVLKDSGNRQGKRELIRYLHVRIHRLNGTPSIHTTWQTPGKRLDPPAQPKQPKRPDAHQLAAAAWSKILHDTDTDEEAIAVLVKLIEAERSSLLTPPSGGPGGLKSRTKPNQHRSKNGKR